MKRQSFEARARRRNTEIHRRNQKKIDANPLFDQAGILDQVVTLDKRRWDALSVAYNEIEIGIRTYEEHIAEERRHQLEYDAYWQMLCEAIGEENAEEVVADYAERWRNHTSMQQWCYRLDYLCTYLSRYLKRTPLDIFQEVRDRIAAHTERTPA